MFSIKSFIFVLLLLGMMGCSSVHEFKRANVSKVTTLKSKNSVIKRSRTQMNHKLLSLRHAQVGEDLSVQRDNVNAEINLYLNETKKYQRTIRRFAKKHPYIRKRVKHTVKKVKPINITYKQKQKQKQKGKTYVSKLKYY